MGIVLLLGVVIGLFALNFPLFRRGEEVSIISGKSQSKGTYYDGALSTGVFIVGDVGEDQKALTTLAQDYYGSGASVMIMDLSGHGTSSKALDTGKGFQDRLVQEVRSGLEAFRKKSGLENESILLVGHGMGARSLLQMLVSDSQTFLGASLIAPEVVLDGKDSGSIYTGDWDDSKTSWISSLSPQSITIPLQIVATEKDDVVSLASLQELYRKLTGTSLSIPKKDKKEEKKEESEEDVPLFTQLYNTLLNGGSSHSDGESFTNGNVTFTFLPSGYHSYQMQSNGVVSASKIWAHSKAGMRTVSSTSFFPLLKVICWCIGAFALLLVSACSMSLAWNRYPGVSQDSCGITLYPWRALIVRLVVWLIGAVIGLLLWFVLWILPVAEPSGRILPAALITGYALAAFLLYGIHKMPGVRGSLQVFTGTLSFWRTGTSTVMLAGLCVLVWFLGESGLFYTSFGGQRTFWIVIFTILMTASFYMIELEADIFSDNGVGISHGFLYRLILLTPLLLPCLFQWMFGQYSSCFRLLHSTFPLAICLNFSGAVHRHSGARLIPAIGAAFLYSLMVVPSAVLLA
jgi:hypothetical protein